MKDLEIIAQGANYHLGSNVFKVKSEDGQPCIQNVACRYQGNDLTMRPKTGYPTFELELLISGQEPIICATEDEAIQLLVNNYCPED